MLCHQLLQGGVAPLLCQKQDVGNHGRTNLLSKGPQARHPLIHCLELSPRGRSHPSLGLHFPLAFVERQTQTGNLPLQSAVTQRGKEGGEGKVNQTGSAYWREVGIAVKSHFELPPSLPVWERAGLKAKVRVTRMAATGAILAWTWEKKSGNEEFDKAVTTLMTSFKSGMRSLPAPSGDALAEINSRGGVIELRGGH